MTVRTDLPLLWEIAEDDYGDAMIFHRHVGAEYPAYIIARGGQRQLAQCSNCMQYLELVGTTDASERLATLAH